MQKAMHMSTAQSDVVRLSGGARDSVKVKAELFVGDEWRRNIRIIMVQARSVGHKALATPGRRVRRRRLAQVPLSDLAIFGAGEEEVWRRLGDNPLHAISMTPVDPSIGVAFTQITRPFKEVVEATAPSRGGKCRGRIGVAVAVATGVFDVEDAHLRVAGAGDQSAIVGMWHELDGEDVGLVARGHGGVE